MKTADLIGPALDWAVAKALFGKRFVHYRTWLETENEYWKDKDCSFAPANEYRILSEDFDGVTTGFIEHYSTNWSQGGPIIEREFIHWGMTAIPHGAKPTIYLAYQYQVGTKPMKGSTPLISAMRCFVASKMGDEVEIPEELK